MPQNSISSVCVCQMFSLCHSTCINLLRAYKCNLFPINITMKHSMFSNYLSYMHTHTHIRLNAIFLNIQFLYIYIFIFIYLCIYIYSKFREVLFICPICVYGPILLAGGVNMRLRCIKKKKTCAMNAYWGI